MRMVNQGKPIVFQPFILGYKPAHKLHYTWVTGMIMLLVGFVSPNLYMVLGPCFVAQKFPKWCTSKDHHIIPPKKIYTPLKFKMVHLKISPWERRVLLKTIIFRLHVQPFGGGNMSPEKGPFKKRKIVSNHHLRGICLVFRENAISFRFPMFQKWGFLRDVFVGNVIVMFIMYRRRL